MNAPIAVLLLFAALGAADEALGGRLGVAPAFRSGLAAMGPLCLSMAGIYSVAVSALSGMAGRGGGPLPFDAALPAGLALAPQQAVAEALVIVAKITAVVCGSLVASSLVLARCGGALSRLAARLGVNEYAVLGLAASLVSSISMLPLYPRMDVRGKVMNVAFTVAGAFVLGGQMAFASSVAGGWAVAAYFAAKLSAGALALWLAARFTKNE